MPSLQQALYRPLEKTPERHALAFIDVHGRFSWLTYVQLFGQAAAASRLLADAGLHRGQVCVLVLPSSELSATLVLATLLTGGIPLLVAPPSMQGLHSSLADILTRVIQLSRAALVVSQEDVRQFIGRIDRYPGTKWLVVDESTDKGEAPIPPLIKRPQTVVALQLTSGTTKYPRICVWEHRAVSAALDGMARAMLLSSEDRCLNWTPLYHDMGLVNNFLLCLTRGVPLAMLKPTDFVRQPSLWLRGLSDVGATMTWSPNFGFALATQRIRDHELQGIHLHHVRAFWNAAERIHIQTIRQFIERFASIGVRPDAVRTNYGCAENVGGATFSDPSVGILVERVDERLLRERAVARVVAEESTERPIVDIVGVGRPAPNIRIRILSRSGKRLPQGRVGEIALQTPSRMKGYLGLARDTRKAISGRLLRTGDLGYVRGGEVFWVGRLQDRITLRGRKLDASDFESVLLRVPGLRDGCFAAFGVDDAQQGTQRVVILAESNGSSLRRPTEIVDDVKTRVRIELDVAVGEVILVPPGTLTKTSSGKRRHRYFLQLYREGRFHKAEEILCESS